MRILLYILLSILMIWFLAMSKVYMQEDDYRLILDRWGNVFFHSQYKEPKDPDFIPYDKMPLYCYKIRNNGSVGMVNRRGEIVIPVKFSDIKRLEDGIVALKFNGFWGYANCNGDFITEFIYDYASNFYQGVGIVKYKDKYNVVNKKGEYVFPEFYDEIIYSKDVLQIAKKDKKGFAYINGDILVEPIYDEILATDINNKVQFMCILGSDTSYIKKRVKLFPL